MICLHHADQMRPVCTRRPCHLVSWSTSRCITFRRPAVHASDHHILWDKGQSCPKKKGSLPERVPACHQRYLCANVDTSVWSCTFVRSYLCRCTYTMSQCQTTLVQHTTGIQHPTLTLSQNCHHTVYHSNQGTTSQSHTTRNQRHMCTPPPRHCPSHIIVPQLAKFFFKQQRTTAGNLLNTACTSNRG